MCVCVLYVLYLIHTHTHRIANNIIVYYIVIMAPVVCTYIIIPYRIYTLCTMDIIMIFRPNKFKFYNINIVSKTKNHFKQLYLLKITIPKPLLYY